MLQTLSVHRLDELEPVLRYAAQRHGASLLAVSNLGQLLRNPQFRASHDAYVFTLCHAEEYARLLNQDIRFAGLLPCRVSAYRDHRGTVMEALSPVEYCRIIHRPELEAAAEPLEKLLRGILLLASQPVTVAAGSSRSGAQLSGLGAREDQMSTMGVVPQRIDCRGSKVEDLAGTGQHDSQGG